MERLTILDLALDMKIMVVIINNLKTDWNHEKYLQARRRIIFSRITSDWFIDRMKRL